MPSDLFRCPSCRQGFVSPQEDRSVRCGHCQATFPADGVIDLLPPPVKKPAYAQRTMEWPWLVRIYESRWFRRSRLAAAACGCTFEEEQALILRSLALRPDARILDLACGPGIHTRPIARAVPGGIVLGLDISWPMLSYATARAAKSPLTTSCGCGQARWKSRSPMLRSTEYAAVERCTCFRICRACYLRYSACSSRADGSPAACRDGPMVGSVMWKC